MKSGDVTVAAPEGLHVRVAAGLVELTKKYDCQVMVSCADCPKADACSVLQLLTLGAEHGKSINIETEGPDEEQALRAITQYFEAGAGI